MNMIPTTYQEAYDEACRAIGELVVEQRLLSRRLAESEQVTRMQAEQPEDQEESTK